MSSGDERFDDAARDAMQDVLGTEHAALWCYSLTLAFLTGDQLRQSRVDYTAHKAQRGAIEQTLVQLGVRPVSAQPAYRTPQPVADAASAARLLVVAETDTLAAWRSLVERTTDRPLRQAALDAMTSGTLRAARWQTAVGAQPAVPVFPGR